MSSNELEEKLIAYYNKFNEDKRLNSRHGQVEFVTSMKYIHECLKALENDRNPEQEASAPIAALESGSGHSCEAACETSGAHGYADTCETSGAHGFGSASEPGRARCPLSIIDIGAGTGRYSIPLSVEGYDVTALELVNHNLGRIKMNGPKVRAFHGNALKLKKFKNNSFDLAILFGPMYHLKSEEEKVQALKEALRVVRPGGRVLVAYIMNEFAVITHAFKDHNIKESMASGMMDENWHTNENANALYSYVRLEDIERINELAGAKREKIISADGPANYMRQTLNAMDEEEFLHFIHYHLATCERMELMGACEHVVDILVSQ